MPAGVNTPPPPATTRKQTPADTALEQAVQSTVDDAVAAFLAEPSDPPAERVQTQEQVEVAPAQTETDQGE